jgi:hypothetical protein
MEEQELSAVEAMLAAGLEAEFRDLGVAAAAERAGSRVSLWRDLLDPEVEEEEDEDAMLADWIGRALSD